MSSGDMPRPIHQCHMECEIASRGYLWLTRGSVGLGCSLVISFTPQADSSNITSNVPKFPAMVTLHDLDNVNFFYGGNPESRT
jgi:hypothetical protein